MAILKRHLLEKVTVSYLCDELRLSPTLFYQWQKQFFEQGTAAFERQTGNRRSEDQRHDACPHEADNAEAIEPLEKCLLNTTNDDDCLERIACLILHFRVGMPLPIDSWTPSSINNLPLTAIVKAQTHADA